MCSVYDVNGAIHEVETRYKKRQAKNEAVSILIYSLYI